MCILSKLDYAKFGVSSLFFFEKPLGDRLDPLLPPVKLLLYNRTEAFFENFHQKWKNASCGAECSMHFSEVEKCIVWSSIQLALKQVSKNSFYRFEGIDLRESHAKLHLKTE